MFFLFFFLPFWGLELLAPVFLWIMCDPRWHPLLAVIYSGFACVFFVLWSRGVLHDLAEHRRHPVVRATWRWTRRSLPEQYRIQLEMFLRMRGWRVDSAVNEAGRVELIARKDRHVVALLCTGPTQPVATPEDFARLAALRAESRACRTALITPRPRTGAAQNAVLHLRFRELRRLENAFGISL